MGIPDLSDFDRYPCLSGGGQNGHLGAVCKSYRDEGGGGFPMVKMKSKNKLPPISGSENTNLIVVLPNSEPIYHFLTPPIAARARQELGNIDPSH